MKVNIKANTIHNQYTAESMELLTSPAASLSSQDRDQLVAKLQEVLSQQLAKVSPDIRDQVIVQAKQATNAPTGSKERESSLTSFLETLKNCFGDTADIVLTAVKLTKVLGGW